MPILSAIILTAIVCAFIAFAVVLAWGEYQTRNIGQAADQDAGTQAEVQSLQQTADHFERARLAQAQATQGTRQ